MMEHHSVQSANKLSTLVVWDAEIMPTSHVDKLLLWRSFGDAKLPDAVSLPQMVEANADVLKSRYLSWVHELGETLIENRRVVDHFGLRSGFSYWWMTLFVEKCNYGKSPQIDNAIKLMAFESWLTHQAVDHIRLATSNAKLTECIRQGCEIKGIGFEWQKIQEKQTKLTWFRGMYRALPSTLRTLGWLVYYVLARWPLRGVGLNEWRQSKGQTSFVSYLFNLTPEAAQSGRFETSYWATLPADLQNDSVATNWLHIYIKSAKLPRASAAAEIIRKFNENGHGRQVHVTLDAFLNFRVILRALQDWAFLRRTEKKLRQPFVTAKRSAFNCWPLFSSDWQRSFAGIDALSNLLSLNLFEAALGQLPAQLTGIYLQENQGWEFACIHAWASAGHGRLIGVPHSTVRYWDLRYFFDPRSYDRQGENSMPRPDIIAVNGPAAYKAYCSGGYPVQELFEVEALRYLHLAVYSGRVLGARNNSGKQLRVLVVGDYLQTNTEKQMSLLVKAAAFLPSDTLFTGKPHPACPIEASYFPGIKIKVTMAPLSVLLPECDVVFAGNVTSAAIDAFCAGVPVVSMLDPGTLNLSPLRGYMNGLFVTTPEALAEALTSSASGNHHPTKSQLAYFKLDPKLTCWRKLLLI